ncbi:hypothetical protein PVL29_004879 [Vitis rotundifolia]|uniref:GDT1 family protein n=1 Tax=Vitis rotundifolia TaxID=103349 RepID=A0AA39A9P8_VITRO|nr:hypothetical protein PVL29_004879 [Vitis rotundifolia]
MGSYLYFRGSGRRFGVVAVVFLLASIFCVALSQGETNGSVLDLGRRSKIVLEDLEVETTGDNKDPDSIGLGLSLDSGLGVFDAFFASLSMIIVSEIGDETFIIAALMAMRHPKSIVLSGALSALIVMTVEEKLESGQGKTSFRRFFSRFCTPIFLESFILTFLAEWGDRSQIATIAVRNFFFHL